MKFDIVDVLENIVGYKGLPYPGVWFPRKSGGGYIGEDFALIDGEAPLKTHSNKGTAIYKKDLLGNYYFMPVTFIHKGMEYEIDCALVNITGKKNIIETALVGRKGTIKELISIQDYQISITGAVIGDGEWSEDGLDKINELYNINEAIELRCALTDVFLTEGDKVVITDLSIPQMQGVEYVQVVEIKCVSDRALELIIV